ncbi:MAG: type I-C CRISPR-associated protein Cas5c, partial [Trichodesmium sp.]
MKIKVWGDYALFTKPWGKPEPTSFPVPPPTALEGLLRAIFFKPEFQYQITRVLILKPIQWQSIRVNAVNKLGAVEVTEARTQRKQKCLKDVAYVIEFDIIAEDVKKYTSMFYRRLERGQYFKMPCLGITDFKCYFGMTNNS